MEDTVENVLDFAEDVVMAVVAELDHPIHNYIIILDSELPLKTISLICPSMFV